MSASRLAATGLALVLGGVAGCAAEAGADAAADAVQALGDSGGAAPRGCVLGRMTPPPVMFEAMADGADAELTRGFQGYLLVVAALRVDGQAPRKSTLEIDAGRDGQPLHHSVRPGVRWEQRDGFATSEAFEVWLSPALVSAFVDQPGEIAVNARVDGQMVCEVRTKVRFVDHDLCMHYEDGTLDCTGAKKGGG